jgi:hypothetical protein
VQPDPRKSKAPSPNNDNILTSGRFPGGAAKAMDLNELKKVQRAITNFVIII